MAAGLVLLLGAGGARADGGLMRLNQTAGPFEIALFTAPTPVRAGPLDVSVMVLAADDHAPVLDAHVEVALRNGDGAGGESAAPATHAAATNKLLYAALLDVPAAGRWTLSARVRAGTHDAAVSCEIEVAPPQAAARTFWPYLALPAVAIALFTLHQWLALAHRRV